MHHPQTTLHGAGVGLRRPLLAEMAAADALPVAFLEVAPENWIGIGGHQGRQLRALTERHPLICHGLSLSIGGSDPLDYAFLGRLKAFMAEHQVPLYSEHLSFCADQGHLYDLLPLPFTEQAVRHTAARIRAVQGYLDQPIAIENVSYYVQPPGEMDELAFLNAVVEEADCLLLFDVNNLYVNSQNHGYDPIAYLDGLPFDRIAYLHMAGHQVEPDGFIVDTHGATPVDPVWALLDETYARLGPLPTLLERDFNLPPLAELLGEVAQIRAHQSPYEELRHVHAG